MTCRGVNKAGNRCGTRYGLDEEGYCGWHRPYAVKCRGIAKHNGLRCDISVGLNARGFCHYHNNQDIAVVDAPYPNQCPGVASSTGCRCRKDWEIFPNGYCKYHQDQASRAYVERVHAGFVAQAQRRSARRSFR
jgi:hypothetical protein